MSKPDEIKLWCWVLGDPPNRAFTVSIELNAPIYNLKKAIHEQKPSFKLKGISVGSLDIYKVGVVLLSACAQILIHCSSNCLWIISTTIMLKTLSLKTVSDWQSHGMISRLTGRKALGRL
jgi:hypothetical protein